MAKQPILEIRVEMMGEAVHLKSENGGVDMIPFRGTVTGPLFTGIVEPCGVDTQVLNAAYVRHMSARYMLTGKDSEGRDAHIYVENNGWSDDRRHEMPFHTVPTFLTDSAALAPYLHRSQFVGEGSVDDEGLVIRFYEIDHDE